MDKEIMTLVANEISFMIHESYYDINRWDNELFVNCLTKHADIHSHPNNENIVVITNLNDKFKYNPYTWRKEVNDKIVYYGIMGGLR